MQQKNHTSGVGDASFVTKTHQGTDGKAKGSRWLGWLHLDGGRRCADRVSRDALPSPEGSGRAPLAAAAAAGAGER